MKKEGQAIVWVESAFNSVGTTSAKSSKEQAQHVQETENRPTMISKKDFGKEIYEPEPVSVNSEYTQSWY